MVPLTIQNKMGPQTYIPPPQSTILQGMLNQGNLQPLITNPLPTQNFNTELNPLKMSQQSNNTTLQAHALALQQAQ